MHQAARTVWVSVTNCSGAGDRGRPVFPACVSVVSLCQWGSPVSRWSSWAETVVYICLGEHTDKLAIVRIRPFPWQGRPAQPVRQSRSQWRMKSFESPQQRQKAVRKPPLHHCLSPSSPSTLEKFSQTRHFILI